MNHTKSALVVALTLTLMGEHAVAQSVGQPNNNIDARVRAQLLTPSQTQRTQAILTGDTDLILLRKPPLFTIRGALTATPTDNAFLSTSDEVDDTVLQFDTSLRIGTRLAEKVDVFAQVGAVSAQYQDNEDLDYSALTAAIGVATRVKSLDIALTYQPTNVYERDFGDRQLTQHKIGLSIGAPIEIKNWSIQPEISAERVLSDPKDFRNWAYSADVSVSRPISNKTPAFVFASLGYERRDFDDYFFDFLGVARVDDVTRATLGVVWRPKGWAEFRLSYAYAQNRSTSDVNGYVAGSGGLMFTLTRGF